MFIQLQISTWLATFYKHKDKFFRRKIIISNIISLAD